MSQPMILVACPSCQHKCRMLRETPPGAKFRCPGCRGTFRFHVHGNGFVELRPADDEPVVESRLPPRSAEQGETKRPRRVFNKRSPNRPIGGYHGYEKSRSYVGALAGFTILACALVAASWYIRQIEIMGKAKGRQGTNAINSDIEAKRKAFQEKQRRVREKLKKQQSTDVPPSVPKVEEEPRPAGSEAGVVGPTPSAASPDR